MLSVGIASFPLNAAEPLRDVIQQEERPEVMVLRRLAAGWRSMLDGTSLSNAAVADDPLADD